MADRNRKGNMIWVALLFIVLFVLGTAYYLGYFGAKVATPTTILEKAEENLKFETPSLPASPLPSNPTTPIPSTPATPPKK